MLRLSASAGRVVPLGIVMAPADLFRLGRTGECKEADGDQVDRNEGELAFYRGRAFPRQRRPCRPCGDEGPGSLCPQPRNDQSGEFAAP